LNLLEEPRDESLRNMLLVNDDCFILLGLKGRFRKHFNISTADNGYAAINQVQKKGKNFFSFIIMDIHMPIMGGIEASNKIYDFLNDRNVQSQISPGKNLNNKVLTKIFAYTSDLSEMAIQDIILRGKFNDILYSLSDS
jgi:CheY-like chemotaxis protein